MQLQCALCMWPHWLFWQSVIYYLMLCYETSRQGGKNQWRAQLEFIKKQLIKTLRGRNDKNWELGRMKIDFSKIMFMVCTWPIGIRVDWIRWGRRGVGSNFPPAASESNQHLNWPHHPIHTLCCQLHIPVYGLSQGCSMFNAVLILLAAHHYEKSTFHAML